MNSRPDPPIPDAPGLPLWVKAYAEYGGAAVELVDSLLCRRECLCGHLAPECPPNQRFRVGAGSHVTSFHAEDCPVRVRGSPLRGVLWTDDYGEALAVFAAHRDRLAEEEP